MKIRKQLLFFGDSITWCQNDYDGQRTPKNKRWTTILTKQFQKIRFNFYGVSGMAVDCKPWSNNDWHTTSQENQFVEKIIATHYPEVTDVFLYFGTNNYLATFEKSQHAIAIATKIKRLHDAIIDLFNVKVHVINLQTMEQHNGYFTIQELQTAITQIFPNCVSLTKVMSRGYDRTHMTFDDNKLIATIIANYITKEIEMIS